MVVGMVRWFLSAEVVVFGVASLMHRGLLVEGYTHAEAATAESVIAAVLAAGLISSIFLPASSRRIGLIVQGFALLGTMVGLFTIAIGIGPRTPLDVTLHAGMIVLLVWGLTVVFRQPVSRAARAE